MKKILFLIMAFAMNLIFGSAIAATVGITPIYGGLVLNAVAVMTPLFGLTGTLRSGLYTELWTGEMIKQFRNSAESLGWINKIKSYDTAVADNNTIHFTDIGGDPEVLVNNTTYPIGIESLEDADVAIGLNKYQTKATKVTDDELRGLSYDKKSTVIERHFESISQLKHSMSLHALAPSMNSDKTPVVTTSGDPDSLNRKKLTLEDIVSLKLKFDLMKIPTSGRVLVLCPEHVSDILTLPGFQYFANQFYNYTSGKPVNAYGFEFYEYVDCPLFTASGIKLPYGTTPGSTDRSASVAFYAPRMMKANGGTKAYIDEPDTQTQEWRVNYRHYFICLPLKSEAIGAIVSASM